MTSKVRPSHWRVGKAPKAMQKELRRKYGKSESKHKLPRFCAARHEHITARKQRRAAA